MNPIDKITESTFTNSSKGLLYLFVVGVFYIVIGVKINGGNISIPWLLNVEVEKIERLKYLYWGVVFFSIYRYILYNLKIIRKYYFFSLYELLKSTNYGDIFIRNNVYSKDIDYVVIIDDDVTKSKIKIEYYDEMGSGWERMATFDFNFSKSYTFESIECSVNPSYDLVGVRFDAKDVRDSFGFSNYMGEEDNSLFITTPFIKNSAIRTGLLSHTLVIYFRTLLTTKEVFDLLVPVLLNLVLFLFFVSSLT